MGYSGGGGARGGVGGFHGGGGFHGVAAAPTVEAAAAMVVADTVNPGSLFNKGPSASAGGLFVCPQDRAAAASSVSQSAMP